MRAKLSLLTLLAIVFFYKEGQSAVRDWDFSELSSKEKVQEAIKNLEKKEPNSNLLSFATGVFKYHDGKYEESIQSLDDSLKSNFILDDYAHYFRGLSYSKLEKWDEAYKSFEKVSQDKNSGPRKFSAIYRQGEIAEHQGKFNLAERHFSFLERRIRSSEKYPYVLWSLAKIHARNKNTFRSCQFVRKLYSKFPAHELTASWNLDLRSVELDGVKPGCLSTLNEQKQRIRNLQYSGNSERARTEIQTLYKTTNELNKFFVDMIYGRFLVDDGDVDEALKLLLPYYSQKTGDIAYQMLIGKAASRKGDHALAINAYMRAHKMRPRSSVGREAMFQAGFVSYLSQDYDGALQRFSEYRRIYGGKNGQAASWLIAWMKYLKGDYKSAYDDFNKFSKMRFSRKMRNLYFDQTKINYWKAVSLVKMGQVNQGAALLSRLASESSRGFYAISAKARLAQINQKNSIRQAASLEEKNSRLLGMQDLTPLSLISASPIASNAQVENSEVIPETEKDILEDIRGEGESAELVGQESEEEEISTEGVDSDSDIAQVEEEKSEQEIGAEIVSTFQDPRLSSRFQRAEILRGLGFSDWSNRELQFIEARTRNKSYLQTLIEKYEQGQEYNRSAYVAETFYGSQRAKSFSNTFGWRKSYPQAYERFVTKASSEFGVPREFIWGIMRTESFFKPKVKSPVGALGLMQVMPLTASKMAEKIDIDDFNVSLLLDPESNVRIGTKYIQRLGRMFNNELPLMAAAYNAGPHRVYAWLRHFGNLSMDEFIEHIPFSQTRGYVKKVMRSYYIYSTLQKGEQKALDLVWLVTPSKVIFTGSVPTKETWEPL